MATRWSIPIWPSEPVILGYQLLQILYTLGAAIAGGYVAAAVAAHPRFPWHPVVVTMLLVGAFLLSRANYSVQPHWYFNALVAVAAAGPIFGGLLGQRWAQERPEVETMAYRAAKLFVGVSLIGAAILRYFMPSSDLTLLTDLATTRQLFTGTIFACFLGTCLICSGLRHD